MQNGINKNDFMPVILGGNLGAYSIARAFYEAYQVPSVVLCMNITGPVKKSKFVIPVIVPDMMNETKTLEALKKLEVSYPMNKILLGSDDWHVEMIIDLKEHFTDGWMLPYVTKEIFKQATTKNTFYQLCEDIGVPYPKTVVLDKKCDQLDLPFGFPIIIKPSDSIAYSQVKFAGKKKIFFCPTKEEALDVIRKTFDSGYTSDLIIQEHIEGDNETIGVVTCYRSFMDKEVKFVSFGKVLLGDPTPSAVGNHLAIINTSDDKVAENVKKLVEALDFCGFANFDVKYNAKKDEHVFFELNGRLGRSNYYITGNGFNPAPYYVNELNGVKMPVIHEKGKPFLYTVVPKSLLKKKVVRNREAVIECYKKKCVVHPLYYKPDLNLYRRMYYHMSSFNYFKKFKNNTENSF